MGDTELQKRIVFEVESLDERGNVTKICHTLNCTFEGNGMWVVTDTEGYSRAEHYNQMGAILLWLAERLGVEFPKRSK